MMLHSELAGDVSRVAELAMMSDELEAELARIELDLALQHGTGYGRS
jgi:hypothetical protein